ncbi:MAG: hypothetical protein IPK26_18305 [Planctomycetes bacterium]|nr:hypothetical protein [Planctomycetota bacterium]
MRSSVIVALGMLSFLPACLEMEQTIDLKADGSGTQSVRLTMTETVMAEVRRAATMAAADAPDPLAIFDKNVVDRELKDAALTLRSHTTTREGPRRTVAVEVGFADLAGLQKSPFCGTAAEWEFAKGPKEGTIRATLYPQGRQAWTDARAKAEAMKTQPDAVAADFFKKRQQQLAGLDVTVRFKLPGKVLIWTRNLDKTGDQEVVAKITAEQIKTPEDLVRRLAPRFEVIFDGTGCTLPLAK